MGLSLLRTREGWSCPPRPTGTSRPANSTLSVLGDGENGSRLGTGNVGGALLATIEPVIYDAMDLSARRDGSSVTRCQDYELSAS